MTPAPFLIPLAAGILIGAFALWAFQNRGSRLDDFADWLSGLWDDEVAKARPNLTARPTLTVVDAGLGRAPSHTTRLGRGHCRRLDPDVSVYDYEREGPA